MAEKGATDTDSAPFCTAYAGSSCMRRASVMAIFWIFDIFTSLGYSLRAVL